MGVGIGMGVGMGVGMAAMGLNLGNAGMGAGGVNVSMNMGLDADLAFTMCGPVAMAGADQQVSQLDGSVNGNLGASPAGEGAALDFVAALALPPAQDVRREVPSQPVYSGEFASVFGVPVAMAADERMEQEVQA